MDLDRTTIELLRPAADRLRRVLQRMDEDDVPAPLRRLADSSARRLPPPLLKRALIELDGSEWLRAEVAADGEMEAGSPEHLFVGRPDEWEEKLALLAGAVADREETKARSSLEGRLSDALNRIAELEEAVRSGEEDVAVAERRVRDRLRAQIETAERGRAEAERQARDEARQAARLASRVERAQAELAAAEARVETLRQLLEKERRSASAAQPEAGGRGWFPSDPVEMAQELDRIVTAVRRPPASGPAVIRSDETVRIPAGMRPDRLEVIQWLMRHPLRWLIDGYNVAFQVSDEPDSDIRRRLVAAAGRLAGLAAPGSMVVVAFDSSVDTSSLPTNRRVRVVYAHSADEWIIEHAAPQTVVVSSDRRVRDEAEQAGAIGVWSEALAAWIAAGRTLGR
ncbi:MAG TPA: hypothetical protein VHL52_02100 [Acidimicrobiia bacterium]|nr:hypothetical protein [Acidimicrobiia bacterium]